MRLTGVSAFDIVSCVLLFYAVVRILLAARAQSHQVYETELQLQSNFSSTGAGTSRRRRTPNASRFIISLVVFFLGCFMQHRFLPSVRRKSWPCRDLSLSSELRSESCGLRAFEKRH